MPVTHVFVSPVSDDGDPNEVGPDEWNDDHDVDISFLDLNDVPATYVGEAGKVLKVNVSETALVFATEGGVVDFVDLGDVPSSYTGEGGKLVAVKSDESGLEFIDPPSSGGSGGEFPNLRPGTANAMDDEYDDTTNMSGPTNGIASKWTLRGTGTPTVTWPADSWVHVEGGATTFGYDQARPSAQDFTVVLHFGLGGEVGSGNSFGGLYLYDDVNGDMYTFHLLTGNNNARVFDLEVASWGNSATFLGGAFSSLKSLTNAEAPNFMRIVYVHSTTGLDFDVSYDGGLTWTNIWAIAADGIGFTRVGWFKTVSGSGSNKKDKIAVDYFRRTV